MTAQNAEFPHGHLSDRHARDRAMTRIEDLISRDTGRNIGQLIRAAKGGLRGAAQSLADCPSPRIGIVTGFYVPTGTPASAETDGPPGALMLGESLVSAGMEVTLFTDAACLSALQAITKVSRHSIPVYELPADADAMTGLRQTLSEGAEPFTHLISIERAGPAADGIPRNMRGRDISSFTAPAHLLFPAKEDRNYCTVGVGDGGNEIGMGGLPPRLIHSEIAQGSLIGCTTACDHLIVCGVSNWGGFALPIVLALLRPDLRENLLSPLSPSFFQKVLETLVEDGPAVDGISGNPELSVDSLPMSVHQLLIVDLLQCLYGSGG